MNCSTTSSKYALAFNNLQPPSIFIDDNEMSVDPRWHDAQTLLPGMSTTVVAVTWTCAFLGSIMFLLRVYVNDRISHSWNISFWFSLATYVLCLCASCFLTASAHNGLGSTDAHLAMHPAFTHDITGHALFYRWIFSSFAIIGLCMGKLAIIGFIISIEGRTLQAKPYRKWFLYSLAILNLALCIPMIPMLWFQCTPSRKSWDADFAGHCAGREAYATFAFAYGSYGVVLDFIFALYPVTIFWKLRVDIKVKIGLMLLFATGLFAGATALIKTYMLHVLTVTSDRLYKIGLLGMWLVIEIWVVQMVACVPAIRPLFNNCEWNRLVPCCLRVSNHKHEASETLDLSDLSGVTAVAKDNEGGREMPPGQLHTMADMLNQGRIPRKVPDDSFNSGESPKQDGIEYSTSRKEWV